MNGKELVTLFVVLMLTTLLLAANTVWAKPSDPAPVEKISADLCSKGSIALSTKWMNDAAGIEKQIRESILHTPEAKLQAKMVAMYANMARENLVLNCAIMKRLGTGI